MVSSEYFRSFLSSLIGSNRVRSNLMVSVGERIVMEIGSLERLNW